MTTAATTTAHDFGAIFAILYVLIMIMNLSMTLVSMYDSFGICFYDLSYNI